MARVTKYINCQCGLGSHYLYLVGESFDWADDCVSLSFGVAGQPGWRERIKAAWRGLTGRDYDIHHEILLDRASFAELVRETLAIAPWSRDA